MNSRQMTWIVLSVLGLLLLYCCYLVLAPFFSEIFLAVVLAIVFHPAYGWLSKKTGRPTLSAWICTLATGLLFLVPVTVVGVVIAQEARGVVDALTEARNHAAGSEWLDGMLNTISAKVGTNPEELREMIRTRLGAVGSAVVSSLGRSLQGIGSWLFSSVVTLVTMYFLFRGGTGLLEESKHWVPMPDEMMDGLFQEVRTLMFANVYGVVAVALAQGILTGLGFWFTGLPSPVLWGALAALLSILPLFGAGLIWVPGVIYLATTGHMMGAGILLGWGLLVVSMADNVIRPIVLSESAQMNTAVMFFSLLGGIDAFGLIGLFAGPLVFSMAIAVIKLLREQVRSTKLSTETSAT